MCLVKYNCSWVAISLSTVVLNSRIDKENYGFPDFHTSNNHLKTDFCSNNAVTLLNAAKSIKIRSIMNFKNLKFTRISSISQPSVRPGSASATALEFLHSKGNRVGFMKLLFRKTFIHCAMVLPFIIY